MDLDLDLSGRSRNDPIPRYAERLRPTVRICAFQLGTVVLFAIICWGLARKGGGMMAGGLLPSVPLVLSLLPAMLILLSSRVRSAPIRRAIPRSAALPIQPDAVLAAYKRGTLQSFAVLEFAALLGIGESVITGSAAYGIILCIASALAMLTRWPRASEVDRLIRGRAKP